MSCSAPNTLGRAAITAERPANEAVTHTTVPLHTPKAHITPARVDLGATRMTCTKSGPGTTNTATHTPMSVGKAEADICGYGLLLQSSN